MSAPDPVAISALALSLVTFGWQIFTWNRDRTRATTSSAFYTGQDSSEPYLPGLHVRIAVDGPRPIVVRMLCLKFDDGEWSGSYLGERANGLSLANGAHYEITLRGEDLSTMDDGKGYLDAVDVYFEDSIGRKYKIKGARKNLEKVRDEEKIFFAERKRRRLEEQAKNEIHKVTSSTDSLAGDLSCRLDREQRKDLTRNHGSPRR